MKYWLMKSELESYSISDLEKDKKTMWDGVRNYQARNFMRDTMSIKDLILFYHSNAKPSGITGVAEVCSKPYPDPTQFDKTSKYFDKKSTKENPRWFLIDIKFVKKFSRIISLQELKAHRSLKNMLLLKRGQRLSVQPVTKEEFNYILKIKL